MMKIKIKRYSILPGFGLTLGYSMTYLGLIVLVPLSALFLQCASLSTEELWHTVTDPRVMASYKLTFGTSLAAASINVFFGFIVAWSLVRYRFPGRKILDALVDLPFALPTAVSGIALTTLYAKNGWIGGLLDPMGIHVAFTPLGITLALTFIGLPFVVRTLQPALEELDGETEEAAASLGANRWQTFQRIIVPIVLPSLYGSVVFISGNMPMKTEISSLLIVTKLEQYDVAGASAIAAVMLTISFLILLSINGLQWYLSLAQTKGV
jgi:sulfate/thiosulfate transport system permease protein